MVYSNSSVGVIWYVLLQDIMKRKDMKEVNGNSQALLVKMSFEQQKYMSFQECIQFYTKVLKGVVICTHKVWIVWIEDQLSRILILTSNRDQESQAEELTRLRATKMKRHIKGKVDGKASPFRP